MSHPLFAVALDTRKGCPSGRCDGTGWIWGEWVGGNPEAPEITDEQLDVKVVPCPKCNLDGGRNHLWGAAMYADAVSANTRRRTP